MEGKIKGMNKWQRKVLNELLQLCNDLGGTLDYTSTHYNKLRDRQKGLMKCYKVIYGVLVDNPMNDNQTDDRAAAMAALEELAKLKDIKYPDRNGNK